MDESSGMTLFIRLLSTPLLSYHARGLEQTKCFVITGFVCFAVCKHIFPGNGIITSDQQESDHGMLFLHGSDCLYRAVLYSAKQCLDNLGHR